MVKMEVPNSFEEIKTTLLNKYEKFMHLKIYVDHVGQLKNYYISAQNSHNSKLINDNYLDAGFDLFLPERDLNSSKEEELKFFGVNSILNTDVPFLIKDRYGTSNINKIDFRIKCSAQMYCDTGKIFNSGFHIYPRSSLSKTNIRLSNSVGIIDSGYRGNIQGMFDVVNSLSNIYIMKSYNRLLQICSPDLCPIYIEIVDDINSLGTSTERGDGGFGSTGV